MDPASPTADDSADRAAALGWLTGRINYERTAVIPYGEQTLKLDRARELLRRLGDPHRGLRIVHIAGTKGKGSTGAMIAAALEAAGVTTGVYSSPHLDRIEERFAVGGAPCSAAELVALVDRVRPAAEAMDRESDGPGGPTYFDLTTAMALAHFAERGVGAVVLEVGLGGRLDSTNVVTPAVAVITSISRDHTRVLGETLAEIAAEKAGILKPGVPAVSGVADGPAAETIERIAAERGSPLVRRGRDFDLVPEGSSYRFRGNGGGAREVLDGVRPGLPGAAQAANAAVALATLGVLEEQGFSIGNDAKRHGVATGRLPGRLERFTGEPLVVVDGAHNDASAEALAEALDALCGETPRERRVLVVAVSNDKNLGEILKPLAQRFGHVVATRFLENPRAFDPEHVAAAAEEAGVGDAVVAEPTPAAAYETAKRLAGPGGAVVFAGSLLFAAEARRLVVAERDDPSAG